MNLRRMLLIAVIFAVFDTTALAQGHSVGDNPVPALTSITPSIATRQQTLDVVLRGSNFIASVTTPLFGVDVRVNSWIVDSARQLTVNITVNPAAMLGPRDVVVINAAPGGGMSVLTNGFVVGSNPPVNSISDAAGLPTVFSLAQNYPNPFNPNTTIIKYELPRASHVRLSVYDVLGHEVSVLVNERKAQGSYQLKFDASGLSSGVYFYRLQAGSFVQTKRLVLMK